MTSAESNPVEMPKLFQNCITSNYPNIYIIQVYKQGQFMLGSDVERQ